MIVSLLNTEITKGFIPKKHGALFSTVDLLRIQNEYKPRMIIGNHLINCDWAVNPKELDEMIKRQGIEGIRIPCTIDDEVYIKEYT